MSTDFPGHPRGRGDTITFAPALPDTAVRQLAQSDPVPNIHAQWMTCVQEARSHLDVLIGRLRGIDDLAAKLAEHDITVSVDLGPIGNAAAAARRDLERDNGRTFEMPRSVTGRCPSCNARPGDRHGANCATLTRSNRG